MSVHIGWAIAAWILGPLIGLVVGAILHSNGRDDPSLTRDSDPFSEPWQ